MAKFENYEKPDYIPEQIDSVFFESYDDKRSRQLENKLNKLVAELPPYAEEYVQAKLHAENEWQRLSMQTVLNYLLEFRLFLRFLDEQENPINHNNMQHLDKALELQAARIRSFSIENLRTITQDDAQQWLEHVKDYRYANEYRRNARKSIKTKRTALNSIFRFLFPDNMRLRDLFSSVNVEIPIIQCEFPIVNDNTLAIFKRHVQEDVLFKPEVDKLIEGMRNVLARERLRESNRFLKLSQKPWADDPEQQRLCRLYAAIAQRNLLMVLLMADDRCRLSSSELSAMDLDMVDFRNRQITFQLRGGDIYTKEYSEDVAELMPEYVNKYRIVLSPQNFSQQNAFFISRKHARMATRSIQEMVQKAGSKILGRSKLTTNQIRFWKDVPYNLSWNEQ